jgi:glycosyltransferase involved in cell wall biosynthesis
MVASKSKVNSHSLIIHVSKLGSELAWFQELANHLSKQGYDQLFLTGISKSRTPISLSAGEEYSVIKSEERYKRGYVRILFKLIQVNLQRIRGEQSLCLSQGHLESLLCLVLKKLFGFKYGIIHHVQPRFFSLLKVNHPVKGIIHEWIYLKYIKNADFIQCLSGKVLDELRNCNVDERKIFHSGPGLNFNLVNQQFNKALVSDNSSDLRFRLIMIGRLSWEKNYLYALEVINELVKMDNRVFVSIYGSGPMFGVINEHSKSLKLQDNVILFGYSHEVLSELSRSGALLHFSKTESYGQVFIEAALMQVPIISTDVGIIGELLTQSDCQVTVLNNRDATSDAETIYSTITSLNVNLHREFSPQHFRSHEVSFVFNELSKFIGRLV